MYVILILGIWNIIRSTLECIKYQFLYTALYFVGLVILKYASHKFTYYMNVVIILHQH